MKKDCAYTRKSLQKYLRGHLFKYEQIRIARHLNSCPVCRSEFQALKKVADTKQLLKDITPPESTLERLKAGGAGLARLKVLVYRPLWLFVIAGVVALLAVNIARHRGDVEIENLEKSLPPSAAVATVPTGTEHAAAVQKAAEQPPQAKREQAAPVRPLVITITPAARKAVRRINAAVGGQDALTGRGFTDSVREITGSLSASDVLALLDKIGQAGTVSYSRKRLEAFPEGQPIPVLLKLKPAPKIAEPSSPAAHAPDGPAATAPVPEAAASAPTNSAP